MLTAAQSAAAATIPSFPTGKEEQGPRQPQMLQSPSQPPDDLSAIVMANDSAAVRLQFASALLQRLC